MQTEEIIDRLRNPQKYNKMPPTLQKQTQQEVEKAPAPKAHPFSSLLSTGIVASVVLIAVLVLLAMLNAKNKAENLTAALDPNQVKGLVYETDFNPNKHVTYVQIYEGQDRNVAVDQLGTTLPIISRYNYQGLTKENYAIIGAAPWALSANIEANLKDVELVRYLLNHPEVTAAFIQRPDVSPLLTDPQLLAAFAQDNDALQSFFTSPLVEQILANPELVNVFSKSRLMSSLLISKAVKFYRDHPQEAVPLIHTSPVLSRLVKNKAIRSAVEENYYLKPIAAQLLNNAPSSKKRPATVSKNNR